MIMLVSFIVVIGFALLGALLFVVASKVTSKVNLRNLFKKFNALKLDSYWTLKSDFTNPFDIIKLRVIDKKIGTDGKTPWVIVKRQSGYKDYMKFEDLINHYVQI